MKNLFTKTILKKNNYILLFLFIGIYTNSFSQNVVTFEDQIAELNSIGQQIISNESDDAKYEANTKYKTALKTLIETEASFETDFSALKTISVLQANNLKIYNWALPLTDGTFEYFAAKREVQNVMALLLYATKRHYPNILESENLALEFIKSVAHAQADLVARWMSLGFIHGVMNTDNMSISGETIGVLFIHKLSILKGLFGLFLLGE